MLRLIKPDKKYYIQYKEMMDEWNDSKTRISPWPLKLEYNTKNKFKEMVKRVEEVEKGENLGEYEASSTYWLYDDIEDKIIGASNIRHYLTEEGYKTWGHIGYGIRPSKRRKGYATKLLNMTLEKAKNIGIDRVLLGAYEDNIGSWKTMEKCGAEFEKTVIEEETGLKIKRYWISLKKRFANSVIEKENVINVKQKIKEIDDEKFKGDIYLNYFKQVSNPDIILEKGVSILDNEYKWLEFYNYNSKVKLTAMYNEKNEIIEWYFDIARKIGKEDRIPYEDDLYLDVVLRPDGKIILLDEEELKEAYDKKEISKQDYDEAFNEANNLIKKIEGKEKQIKEFTDKYLKLML